MHLSKKLESELKKFKSAENIEEFVKARRLMTRISPFDWYRIKLMGDILQRQSFLGNILDIGSNIGSMAKFYRDHSCQITFCDVDAFIIKGAKIANIHSAKLNFTCGDIRNLPFKDSNFDTIIVLETIEHLHRYDRTHALEEILRVAKPNANIYISTPNRFSLAGLEGRIIEFFLKNYKWDAWNADHRYVYHSWEFIRFLRDFNDRIEIKRIYGSYFLPGSSLVRMPFFIQRILGFFSYLIARYIGYLFPFRYLGFTTIISFKKI